VVTTGACVATASVRRIDRNAVTVKRHRPVAALSGTLKFQQFGIKVPDWSWPHQWASMTYGPVVSREYGPIQLGLPGPAADDDVQIGDENRLLGALAGGEVRGHLGGGRGAADQAQQVNNGRGRTTSCGLGGGCSASLGGHGLCEDCCDPFRAALVCAAGFSALAGRATVTWFSAPRCSTPHAAPRKVFCGRRLLSLRRSPLGLLRWVSRRCPYRGGPGRVLVAAQVRGDLGGGGGQAAVVAEAKQPGALAIVTPSLP